MMVDCVYSFEFMLMNDLSGQVNMSPIPLSSVEVGDPHAVGLFLPPQMPSWRDELHVSVTFSFYS